MFQFHYTASPCPFCGDRHGRPYHAATFPHGTVSWVQCPNDRLIYQHPRLDRDTLQQLYNSVDYTMGGQSQTPLGYFSYFESEPARLAMGRVKIRRIEKLLGRRPLRIMEVGCASGSFLKVCADHGHDVVGVDLSSIFAEFGQRQYRLDIRVGRFEEMDFAPGSFDLVTIFGSLICLTDPLAVFRRIHALLKPGGWVVFNAPVLDGFTARTLGKRLWVYRPSCQVLYTREAATQLLARSHFTHVHTRRDIQSVSIEKLALVAGMPRVARLFGPLRRLYLTVPLPSVYEFAGAKG